MGVSTLHASNIKGFALEFLQCGLGLTVATGKELSFDKLQGLNVLFLGSSGDFEMSWRKNRSAQANSRTILFR